MAFLDRLYRATFRGASFLMRDTELNAGRKTVTFEYPNQDRRYVDDLGKMLRKYAINGLISEPNYNQKKRALINALTQPGLGILVHPTDGRVKVVAKPYTIIEDLTRAGECIFRMEFEEATEGVYPLASSTNISLINDITDQLFNAIDEGIGQIFDVTDAFIYNVNDAQNLLIGVGNRFHDVTQPFSSSIDAVNQFNNTLRNFNNNIFVNIKDSGELGSSVKELFDLSDNLGGSASDKYKLATGFYGFGSGDAFIPQNTAQRIERKRNRAVINSAINMGGLANAYNNAVDIDYTNNEELEATLSNLNAQYNYTALNNGLTDDALGLLTSLRNEVRKFFDKASVNISKIETITTQPTTLTNLVYAYYGNLDNFEAIRQLNNIANPARISGEIKILSGSNA